MAKQKTISGPYQTYQIRVSVSTLAELQSMQPPGVDGAPTFFRDNGLPWFWFSQLPPGFTSSPDRSTGATTGKSGFYVSLFALVAAVSLGSFLTVARASSSRLLDVPASTLFLVKDGARTYVRSYVAGWHWKANFPAATATDNIATCRPSAWAALGFDGAFVRDVQGDETARTQTFWRVDANALDEEGDGSDLDPVKTDAEILRRWGTGTIPLKVPVTVSYARSPTTKTNYDVRYLDGGGLRLTGTPTLEKSGTFSNVTTVDPSLQRPWDVTGTNFVAGDLVRLCRIKNGPRAGNTAVLAKEIAANQMRTSPFVEFVAGGLTGSPTSTVTPQINDEYDVLTWPTLTIGTIRVVGGTNSTPSFNNSTPVNCVVIDSLRIDGQGGSVGIFNGAFVSENAYLYLRHCLLGFLTFRGTGQVGMAGGAFFGNVGFNMVAQVFCAPAATLFAFAAFNTVSISYGCSVQLGQNCLFQNAALQIRGWVYGELVSSFDRTAANGAIVINDTGTYRSFPNQVADLLWGDGNAGVAVRCISGGRMVYTTKPTINTPQGPGRQSLVGGTNRDWGAIPYVELANLAMIVANV